MFVFALAVIATRVASIPSDWQSKVDSHNGFYTESDLADLSEAGYPSDLNVLPLIANGYLSHSKGVRSDTFFVSGIFNNETTSPSHRARIPATFAITVENEIETQGALMDIETGIYYRRGLLSDSSYELRWYAHRTLANIYVMELSVTLAAGANQTTLSLANNMGEPSVDIAFTPQPVEGDFSKWSLEDVSANCGSTRIAEDSTTTTQEVCYVYTPVPSALIVTAAQSAKVLTFVTAIRTSLDVLPVATDSILTTAVNDLKNALQLAEKGELQRDHVDAWAELWQHGVSIESDADSASRYDVMRAVNTSLFAILSSVRADWPHGLAPGGLNNYYNGHSFWDTETWMFPPLLLMHPTIAGSLLQYRFDRLEGARKKAKSYDPPWDGAMFPWESAFSGVETCPLWAPTGLREQHISGDISIAVWQYWQATRDVKWLSSVGNEVVQGIAEFFVSRISVDAVTGEAHILDIIPPDEYVDHVDDSVYTNYVASLALRIAADTLDLLGDTASADKQALYRRLADSLVILFDAELGIHPEYKGYDGSTIKQADAVLLHYPLGMTLDPEVQVADLEFYSLVTDINGPAMTWGMHAVGYLDSLRPDTAAKYLNMSFQDNSQPPFYIWSESPNKSGAINFVTGAGGFLQTVISGYAGVRLTSSGRLSFSPVCLEGSSGLTLRGVSYLQSELRLSYHCSSSSPYATEADIEVTAAGSSSSVALYLLAEAEGAQPIALHIGQKISLKLDGSNKQNLLIFSL